MGIDIKLQKSIDDHPVRVVSLILAMEQAIEAKYAALGGAGALGVPTTKDVGQWTFAGSTIVYDPDSGQAFEIHGDIYQKWLALGGEAFGTPVTDESPTPDGVGRFNHFTSGRSIYWTPQTGSHAVVGAIRDRWQALGWEVGYLGYPVSDEVDFADGGRASEFEHGGIYFWGDTGAIDLRDVVVHFTGLHCFGETDWDQGSDADEPYLIVSVGTPTTSGTVRTQVYQDVDGGETRPDLVEVYRGRPYGINLSAVLMENDFGDPNAFRDEIQTAVGAAHAVGTAALGLIPVVGPFVAAVAGPSLGALMPKVGQAINDLLDTQDDLLGTVELTWSAKQMVLLAAQTPNQQFDGIGYKVESPLISSDGASYKLYFGIVPT